MIAKSILLLLFVIFFASVGVHGPLPTPCKMLKTVIEATKPVPSEFINLGGDDDLTAKLEEAGNRLILIEFPQHGYYPSVKGDKGHVYSSLTRLQYGKIMASVPGVLIIRVKTNECEKAVQKRGIVEFPTFSIRKEKNEKQENQVYVLSDLMENSTTNRLIEALKNA